MTLQDILDDIHALDEIAKTFERKYGVLSDTFYRLYCAGEEPADDAWVLDWAEWAGACKALLRRREQYERAVHTMAAGPQDLGDLVMKTARREKIPVPA